MKRLLVCVLILNAFLVSLAFAEGPGGNAGLPLCATEIGDVDASGIVDLTDGIGLLSFLFLGNPPELVENCFAQQVSDLEQQLSESQAGLTGCETDLATSQADLTACQADLIAVEDDLTVAEADLIAVEDDLTVAKADLATCQAALLACDPPPTEIEGFTFVENNTQGFPEYTHDQTGSKFVLLPGGTFEMGSPTDEPNGSSDERPVHAATLDSFLIAKHECTQAEYEAVMADHATLDPTPSNFTGDDLPVEQVSWDDLKAADGFLDRTGLSMPSEAQWEYAARGGTQTAFSFGDDCNANFCDVCAAADVFMWWCANASNTTHSVGDKLPNPFGLFDMHGNVWEWVEDDYDSGFYSNPASAGPNPVATSDSGNRIIRGGSWCNFAAIGRSASRYVFYPDFRMSFIGFRLARPLP